MELVYVSVVSGIFGLIGLLLWDRSKDKRYKYELKRFQYGKKAKKELVLLEQDAPRSIPGVKDAALSKIIEKALPYLSGGDYDEEGGGVEDIIANFIENNPEIVRKFLGGGKGGGDNDVYR